MAEPFVVFVPLTKPPVPGNKNPPPLTRKFSQSQSSLTLSIVDNDVTHEQHCQAVTKYWESKDYRNALRSVLAAASYADGLKRLACMVDASAAMVCLRSKSATQFSRQVAVVAYESDATTRSAALSNYASSLESSSSELDRLAAPLVWNEARSINSVFRSAIQSHVASRVVPSSGGGQIPKPPRTARTKTIHSNAASMKSSHGSANGSPLGKQMFTTPMYFLKDVTGLPVAWFDQGVYSVGSDLTNCTVLASPSLQIRHFIVEVSSTEVAVSPCPGTLSFIDNARLLQRTVVKPGHSILAGDVRFTLVSGTPELWSYFQAKRELTTDSRQYTLWRCRGDDALRAALKIQRCFIQYKPKLWKKLAAALPKQKSVEIITRFLYCCTAQRVVRCRKSLPCEGVEHSALKILAAATVGKNVPLLWTMKALVKVKPFVM